MAPAQSKLRRDLIISRQQGVNGRPCCVIKDPTNRRFFYLKEIEHEIIGQLDGSRSLDEIRDAIAHRVGAPLSCETLERFVHRLAELGLLETKEGAHSADRRVRWVAGNFLYLRLKAFDPDPLLARLAGKVEFLFTPHFLASSAALIFVALAVTIANSSEIGHRILGLFHVQGLVAVWMTVVLVVAGHEFAHGLTCKKFGGEVHEIGFLLIYFQPALYCNVSDAWLFPEKSKRLWVTFAGAHFEIVLWAVATLIWRVTDPDTAANYVALIVMATSGVKSLFNLNPLIKLDGYYLLSDYLEIPNLRQRAFKYLRGQINRCVDSTATAIAEVGSRERRIYLAYGLLAGSYSWFILGFVMLQLGGFLTRQYQGLGFLSILAVLGVVLGRPLRRVDSPRDVAALAVPDTRRHLPLWMKRRAKGIMLAAAALLVLFVGRSELRIPGEFTITPIHNADVRAAIDGIIAYVYKDEGNVVQKGELIVRLDNREYVAELRKVEAEIAETESRLRMLTLGPRREEIELARTEVKTAKIRREHASQGYEEAGRVHAAERLKAEISSERAQQQLAYATSDMDRIRALFAKGLVSRKDLEAIEQQVTVRQKELEEAHAALTIVLADELSAVRKERDLAAADLERGQGRLNVLVAGSRPEEIDAMEAAIAGLNVRHRFLKQEVERAQVLSPAAGVIATARLRDKIGQRVGRGDLIAKVHQQKSVTAEILVSEKDIADVHPGQPIVLKARAFPGESFLSRVVAIAPVAVDHPAGFEGRVVKVTADIDNASHLLKSEMTGHAKIVGGKRRIIDLITRRFARYIRVEFWSWW